MSDVRERIRPHPARSDPSSSREGSRGETNRFRRARGDSAHRCLVRAFASESARSHPPRARPAQFPNGSKSRERRRSSVRHRDRRNAPLCRRSVESPRSHLENASDENRSSPDGSSRPGRFHGESFEHKRREQSRNVLSILGHDRRGKTFRVGLLESSRARMELAARFVPPRRLRPRTNQLLRKHGERRRSIGVVAQLSAGDLQRRRASLCRRLRKQASSDLEQHSIGERSARGRRCRTARHGFIGGEQRRARRRRRQREVAEESVGCSLRWNSPFCFRHRKRSRTDLERDSDLEFSSRSVRRGPAEFHLDDAELQWRHA